MEVLDVDGSEDLDLQEWTRFFTARRISLSEFGILNYFLHHFNVAILNF